MLELGRLLQRECSKNEYEIWAVLVAEVWRFLCKQKHDMNGTPVVVNFDRSTALVLALQEARRLFLSSLSLDVEVGKKKWFPSVKGFIRLDVDASVNFQRRSYGVGAMVRDWQGKLKAGLAKSIVEPASVLEAEINAILLGVGLCLQEELVPFVVFSDSLLAVRMLKGGRGGDTFLEDELPSLTEAYSKGLICDFCHMFREANTVAHVVARFGADCTGMITWNNFFPHWLGELI
ncbi:hypothetical protein C2S53_011802 [Perilla frutescens var. hirtella]|uniref:RNase H type-1 domain-containing protein n=1 Tax=Perilla frutescens var. hirtella TaxID=608512 RepID=A0AAD4JHW8_PERFH|nr:hypothetical protein C2S53_011802 [Perilla frutescens var. hirtella]